MRVAKDCLRVLRPGGVLRIVVPDLRLIVHEYLTDPDPLASHHFPDQLSVGHTFHDLIHPGANHSQMFDERSLMHLLQQVGLSHSGKPLYGKRHPRHCPALTDAIEDCIRETSGVPEPLVALCPGPSAWSEPAREQEEHLRARQRHPEADAQTGAAHIALQIVLQDVEKFQLRHNGPG